TAYAGSVERLLQQVEQLAAESPLTAGERHIIHRLRCRSVRTCPFGQPPPEVARLNQLLGEHPFMVLVPGEAWSDAVNTDLGRLAPADREKWLNLFRDASTATGARPSSKWMKTAKDNLKDLGAERFSDALRRWFPAVNAPRTVPLLGGGGVMARSDTGGT